jgi:hypothetical protein
MSRTLESTMNLTKHLTILCAAIGAAFPPLLAQDGKPPAAAEMPNPKHKEHDALKPLAGSWDFVMKMEAMPGVKGMEEAVESRGTEQAELILGGLWLKSVFRGTHKGEACEGVWLAGYDPFQKKYTGLCIGSDEENCGPSTMTGTFDSKTRTWTWTGKCPGGEMRSVHALTDDNTTVETCYLTTPDGKETKCMEITRKRAKGPAAVEASAKNPKAPPKEMAQLHKDVGEWDAIVQCAAPGQPASEDKGTERVSAVCNGRWLWSDFTGQFQGQPFAGHGITGWDPNEKKYVSFWLDSMSATCMSTSGALDPSGKSCKLEGKCVCPERKPMSVQQTIDWTDANTRRCDMQFATGDEVSKMTISYTRKRQG